MQSVAAPSAAPLIESSLMNRLSVASLLVGLMFAAGSLPDAAAAEKVKLSEGDHIVYIGNTLADRMQHYPWLEARIHAMHPGLKLTFRNLAFPGDELKTRPREDNFGSADQWMTKCEADVVFAFFGYNESFAGEAGLPKFRADLAEVIDQMQSQQYNGESAPEIVMFSPIAHENLNSRHLPDGAENNRNLAAYTAAMRSVCEEKQVAFVDLFTITQDAYDADEQPLTINGIHLSDHGNAVVAKAVVNDLFGQASASVDDTLLQRVMQAVNDKNYYWFSRYRVVDGYNVFGGRSRLAWFGQSNADVMMREMEIFDVMTANRDRRIWAVAQGGDLEIKDDNIPQELTVRTNKPGPLEGERHPYLGPEEAIDKMHIADGLQVNVFASEEMFPEMVNPVQMAVDTNGRLFASVWPSYPHWNPTQPRRDRILCLPDDNGDGVADRCVVFADELNSVTGFEFWGGGMLVAALPELWFLKDTDGDDVADVKVRMLQGLSSADSHHSANAMVLGPDGWVYWSRGIFNVATMETPTGTYRSTQSGVHRFNPRTFEMEFHFPIGPNPHGDVFDRWGYQFANDGTGGTGSYINIGKGVGNRQWFDKQWRPVAATGILSSSHFPEENNENFLICNTIGFLGILQHTIEYQGADIRAKAIEPILYSDDQNFRPTDLEIGSDGALYVSDWCNVLIGHMQHNMRDPNRDDAHGRIYRVTAKGRPLLKPFRLKGKPISEVCQAFFAKENTTRYHARIELSGRESEEVMAAVNAFAAELDPTRADPERDEAQALLECLWVFADHRMPNLELLGKVFGAQDARIRAAAIRTLGQWSGAVDGWQSLLAAAAQDQSPLVRAEAIKSAVNFKGLAAAEVIFEAASRPLDSELEAVLKYATSQLDVDRIARDAVASGASLSTAAQSWILRNASVTDLLKLERTEAVAEAILKRSNVPVEQLQEALISLATFRDVSPTKQLLNSIAAAQRSEDSAGLAGLCQLLARQSPQNLNPLLPEIETLALDGDSAEVRGAAYAAWVIANETPDDAFLAATREKGRLRDFLEAVPLIHDDQIRATLYEKVQPLLSELPANLDAEEGASSLQQSGVTVDYFYPSASNVALETLAKMTPRSTSVVPQIAIHVPEGEQRDKFALRFTGAIRIDRAGQYTFFATSDDGSRIYIGDQLVVNHDGLHGMSEKKGRIQLPAGSHPITVTYFDNGGGDGLKVEWSGPRIRREPIPADRLTVSASETLHDLAIRALVAIPGHEQQKVRDLAALVKANRHRATAIQAMTAIPVDQWPERSIRPTVDNLIGFLTEMPARFRTSGVALDATKLANDLSKRLPADQADAARERLQNLDVRVIAIGTVPHRMIFDKERIVVQAGKPVEFRFSNTDDMPHNFAITLPGALEEVGLLAEATGRAPDAMVRHYIPESDKILLSSRLLQTGQNQSLSFEAPTEPGVYPYVCTYPGHWRRMFGALYVVDSLEQYQADPEAYLAANSMEIRDPLLKLSTRGREWKYEDLISSVSPLPHGRSFEVGQQVFTVATCVACHKLAGEGRVFGPDLAKLDEKKKTTEHILRSLIDPSKDIEDKYRARTFVLSSGRVLTGMVMEESADALQVVVDPLARASASEIARADIDEEIVSPKSFMPQGLLDRLSAEEILDLIAFVYAGGDKKHPIYHTGHDHQH
jgi:putative heme-binding domain-containing protein